MKKLMTIAVIILLLSVILSCAVRPHLIDSSFIYPTIKTEGIANLPVAGEGVDRSTRKAIGLSFEKELSEKYPNAKIVGAEHTGQQLVENKLVADYDEVVSTYQMTEIIKPDAFAKIGSTIRSRYLLIPIVQRYDKQEVKGGNKYTIIMETQVWDNFDQKIVFRIITQGEDEPSSWLFSKETLEEAAEDAIKTAVKAFPKR